MALNKNSIVFFWIGKEIKIPQVLVHSVRLVMGDEINVIQLTNNETDEVEGVNKVERFDLSNQIMIARLEAYSQYLPETENTFFCDADSIFINKFKLPENNSKKIFLSPRQEDFNISHTFPEYYEEFIGKTANEVMPFLFGAILAIGNQQKIFKEILNIAQNLPDRFHRWYGDQYALKKYIDKGFYEFGRLDPDFYLNIIRQPLELSFLKEAYEKKVQLITFKGPQSKMYLDKALILLKYFYG